jgi:CheY-like chemotaxis protein
MNLQSLLVCSDDRTLRVLRRVLGELEIGVEHCADPAGATKKLARQTFEAVIVDCEDERSFSLLKSVRRAQHNKKSVAVAIVDENTGLHSAFEMGAHFVVYKPISSERAKSSFRAARALMKRERRRSVRVPVRIPVSLRFQNGHGEQAFISGLSEGGVSIRFIGHCKNTGPCGLCFTLPETLTVIEATGLIAWRKADRQAGVQFVTFFDSARRSLKEWLRQKSGDEGDPPIRCTLTDISLGGCFLRTDSPFPVETRVELLLRVADFGVRTEGKVRVMHPEFGMGVEFAIKTVEHRRRMEELIHQLALSHDIVPEVLVEPEGLDWGKGVETSSEDTSAATVSQVEELQDPLLELFRARAMLPKEQFLMELEKQRPAPTPGCTSVRNTGERTARHRREPRIEVSLPVRIWGKDNHQQSFEQTASMLNISHRGSRIAGVRFQVKPGEIVHLVYGRTDGRFRVIWVGEAGTPQEGQIGLQGLTTDN